MHWKVEFSAGYFQNENVDGATVSNKGIKTTQPSLSLSVQERAVIQQKFLNTLRLTVCFLILSWVLNRDSFTSKIYVNSELIVKE